MAVTRIKNNQITDATVVANAKLVDYSVSSAKLANNLVYNSDFTVSGNLTVSGNTTTIDTTITTIEDPVIVLASTQTSGSPVVDIGYLGYRGNQSNIAFVWDESADEFVTVFTSTGETNSTVTITSYANFHTNDANIGGNIVINGTTSLVGNIVGPVSFAGNISAGNLLTSGQVSATGNVTGGNVNTAGAVSATGDLTGGNVNTAGAVSATGNVTGGNFNTAGIVTATGNIGGGNITTGGQVQATGNVTGGNLLTGGLISATSTITSATTITGGNLATAGTVSATGNITGGNVNTAGQVSATGNVTGGNILYGNGIVTGTGNIYGGNIIATEGFFGNIDLSGDITVNSLTSNTYVSAGGNITGANLFTSGSVSATGNLTANNVNTDNVYSSGALTLTAASGDITLNPSGNIIMDGGKWINNVNDPVQAQDAATKQYVDDAVSSGIHIHTPVYLEANSSVNGTYAQGGNTFTVNQTIAGNTVVFSTAANLQPNDQLWFSNSFEGIVANTSYFVVSAPNTSAAVLSTSYGGAPVTNITSNTGLTQGVRVNPGVGATLTNAGANATLTIDGVATTNGMRVLIYSQGNAVHNGVYDVTEAGNATTAWQLTRSSDADLYIPDSSIGLDEGSYFYVQAGDTGAGESYVQTAPTGEFIIGYDPITFTQFSASQVYTANTNAGLSLTGTVFSAKVDNNTTAFDGGGNIIVKAGANLTTPNIGAATGTSLSTTGNVTAGSFNTAGIVSATGTVYGGNIFTGGQVTATGNVTGANVNTAGAVSATGNVTGGNLLFGSGIVSGTGNIYANNIFANISGNIDAGGANTEIQFNDGDLLAGSPGFTFNKVGNVVTANGNITGANLITGGLITATSNITGGNILTGGLISATGSITSDANVTGANINTTGLVTATGNVTGGNINTGGLITATGNITGANLILTSGIVDGPVSGCITINGSDADVDFAVDGDTLANIFYVDAGTGTASFGASTQVTNAIVNFATTTSVKMPVGNTAQRPATGVTGMVRFNTSDNNLEVYNNSSWEAVGVPAFTVIADEQFNGDGSTVAFTLATSQTTNSCIVSINGVVQIPTLAYSVTGTTLTFTEAPLSGDVIDVRQITTTTTVTGLNNSSGNAELTASETASAFDVKGNLIPVLGNTYTLGNASNAWDSLYVAGNTIYLGTLQLKQQSATTFAVFQADGITAADIDVGNIDVSALSQGNSTIGIYGTGQGYITVNGNSNVLLASNTSVLVNGAFSATGNITGSYFIGNGSQLTGIDATAIQNGTANVRTFLNGNVTTSAAGTANVVTVTSTGQLVAGIVSATGNITGSYFIGNGSQLTGIDATAIQNGTANVRTFNNGNVSVSAAGTANVVVVTSTGTITTGSNSTTGNVIAGNVNTAGIISATGNLFAGNAVLSGNLTVNGNVTYINSNVVTINDLAINLANNAATAAAANNGGIEVGPQGAPYITFLYNNSANTFTSSAGLSAVGNVVGANFTTAGLVSATGNVSGGNLNVTGNIVDTGPLSIITGSNGNLTLNAGSGSIVINSGIINGQANGVGNIGSASTYFNTVFARATSAQYADLAEKYVADADYEPGTVVMFGGSEEVTVCSNDACRRVAGVISTNPSYIMNGTLEADHVATVALTGRVPCKVTGTVRKGDLMVSAGNGRARAEADPKVGTVIGKALADFDGVDGVIEVVVGRF
jgi:hypothetical protein